MPTITIIGICPLSGVGALITDIRIPNTTPPRMPAPAPMRAPRTGSRAVGCTPAPGPAALNGAVAISRPPYLYRFLDGSPLALQPGAPSWHTAPASPQFWPARGGVSVSPHTEHGQAAQRRSSAVAAARPPVRRSSRAGRRHAEHPERFSPTIGGVWPSAVLARLLMG